MQLERITFAFAKRAFILTGLKPIQQDCIDGMGGADAFGAICTVFGSERMDSVEVESFIHLLWGEAYTSGFISGYDGAFYSCSGDLEYKLGQEDGKLVWASLVAEGMAVVNEQDTN